MNKDTVKAILLAEHVPPYAFEFGWLGTAGLGIKFHGKGISLLPIADEDDEEFAYNLAHAWHGAVPHYCNRTKEFMCPKSTLDEIRSKA